MPYSRLSQCVHSSSLKTLISMMRLLLYSTCWYICIGIDSEKLVPIGTYSVALLQDYGNMYIVRWLLYGAR